MVSSDLLFLTVAMSVSSKYPTWMNGQVYPSQLFKLTWKKEHLFWGKLVKRGNLDRVDVITGTLLVLPDSDLQWLYNIEQILLHNQRVIGWVELVKRFFTYVLEVPILDADLYVNAHVGLHADIYVYIYIYLHADIDVDMIWIFPVDIISKFNTL